jgi:hypothetical protein
VRRVAIDGRFICVQERAEFDQATACFTTVPSGAFSSIVSATVLHPFLLTRDA